MTFITIITAMLAGWAIRKKSAEIYRIRRANEEHRRALRRLQLEEARELKRTECWLQVGEVQGDYTDALHCWG